MTNNFDDLYAQFKADVRRAFDSPFSRLRRLRRIAKRMAKADERLAEVRATRAMLMRSGVQDFSPADRREAMTITRLAMLQYAMDCEYTKSN